MCPSVSGFMIFNSTRHVFCELCIFYSHDIIISRAKYKKCIFSTLRTSHACQVQMFHRCFKKLQLLEVLQLLLEFLQCDLKSCYDLTLSVVFHYMYNILASTTPGCIFWILKAFVLCTYIHTRLLQSITFSMITIKMTNPMVYDPKFHR